MRKARDLAVGVIPTSIRPILSYLRYSNDMRRSRLEGYRPAFLLRSLPMWLRSQRASASPLTDGVPWLSLPAIWFLSAHLERGMRVLEFGSGGSTVFFSRKVERVVSVEHDSEWAAAVSRVIGARGFKNVELRLRPPREDASTRDADPGDPDTYASAVQQFGGFSFREYASGADDFPDGHFDVVLIDGRARPSCFKHAKSKVRRGGFLVLDNAERDRYRCILENLVMPGWQRHDLAGPVPYSQGVGQTLVWTRRDDSSQQ